MSISQIQATIDALRATLSDLEFLAACDEVSELKRILIVRIAELESLKESASTTAPLKRREQATSRPSLCESDPL